MRYIWLHTGCIWWWRKIFKSSSASPVFSITSFRSISLLWLEVMWVSAVKGVCFTRHSKEKHNRNSYYGNDTYPTTCYCLSIFNASFLMEGDQFSWFCWGLSVVEWQDLQSESWCLSSAVVIRTCGIFLQARIVLGWWFNCEWTCEGHLDQEHQYMGQSWQQEYLWVV